MVSTKKHVYFVNAVRLYSNDIKNSMSYIERKQRGKEKIKKDILEAALKIAIKDGWQSVTIRKIADSIEYTPPIVYEHFENKEALLQEIILSGFINLNKKFNKAKNEEQDPRKLLLEYSLIHWDFACNNRELYKLMFSLERATQNEEAVRGLFLFKENFMQITGKKEAEDVMPLILNWICLIIGTEAIMMHFESVKKTHGIDTDPRQLYIEFINRFISSIS